MYHTTLQGLSRNLYLKKGELLRLSNIIKERLKNVQKSSGFLGTSAELLEVD